MHVKLEADCRSYNSWWKMPTAPDLQNWMKFWHFLNVLQNSWNIQNLLESPLETCMWNVRQFGEVPIFDGKCRQRRTFKTEWNFDFFSMFSKNHETYRSYWNHHQKCMVHVKFEAVQRSYNFWQKNAYSSEPSNQDEILTFTQYSPKFMKLTGFIEITTRNMHVKFEAVWRNYNFWQKTPTAPDLRNRIKF